MRCAVCWSSACASTCVWWWLRSELTTISVSGPAPHRLERARHLLRRRQAHGDRQQVELAEHALQERHLHFERVLERVGRVGHAGEAELPQALARRGIDPNLARSGVEKKSQEGSARPRIFTR